MCVFIDERDGNWLYNKDGCTVDIAFSNEDRTICVCNHLTTFAVLTHDLYDEEMLRILENQKFRYATIIALIFGSCLVYQFYCRYFYFNFSLAAFVVVIIIFALVVAPMVSLNVQSSLPVHTLISHVVKHLSILLLVSFGGSGASCAASSALLCYCTTAVCSVSWINCLDILLDIWQGKKRWGYFILLIVIYITQ